MDGRPERLSLTATGPDRAADGDHRATLHAAHAAHAPLRQPFRSPLCVASQGPGDAPDPWTTPRKAVGFATRGPPRRRRRRAHAARQTRTAARLSG